MAHNVLRPCLMLRSAAITLGALLLWTTTATAQTLELNTSRTEYDPELTETRNDFPLNLEDCVDGRALLMSVTTSDAIGYRLEVWATRSESTDCTVIDNRTGDAPCWQVAAEKVSASTQSVPLDARDVAAGFVYDSPRLGTASCDLCFDAQSRISTAEAVTFYFMLMENGDPVSSAQWTTDFDVSPPTEHLDLSVGAGESSLVLEFELPESGDTTDISGYRYYCDDGTAGQTLATLSCSGAGGAGGSSASTTGSAGASGSSCGSGLLVEGEYPTVEPCGSSASGSTSKGTIRDLDNGSSYAVAVAPVDASGNVGRLSNVVCATPAAVTDFFEAYRQAGGQASGGFCALSPGSRSAAWALLGFAGLALVLRRRRS